KFTPEQGEIKVSSKIKDSFAQVVISDNGIGMDEVTVDRIFEQFYQGDMSHTGDGSGLGLPLAKRIVEIYNGSIGVTSNVGEGTTFEIKLPILKSGKVKKKR
ncbi:MAG: sensor histidine kinase, partial [Proteocatella sp.]